MVSKFMTISVIVAGLSACTTTADTPPPNVPFSSLAGTNWELVEIQSMDDAQGTKRPDDPSKYTLSFASDGSVAARLDCNRGTGSWANEISNATGGSLTFGPMAVTKALCPPPTLGEKLEKQLPYVRSFVIRDGNMHMSLMADGGILVWRPGRP